MSIQNVQYEAARHGAGIISKEIILDHANFTASTTTGKFEWTHAVPAYVQRLGCVIETIEAFNVAVSVTVGIADAGTGWTAAGASTYTCTALGYKIALPYGAATIATSAYTTAEESVHITLTQASAYSTVTSGKIKVKIIYLATQE